MPTRAPRACHCGRIQPCPVHVRKVWNHYGRTRQERGLNAEYDHNRVIVMREETHCWLCNGSGLPNDQADHVIPRARGGTNERSNLRRAHRRCNAGRERAVARKVMA